MKERVLWNGKELMMFSDAKTVAVILFQYCCNLCCFDAMCEEINIDIYSVEQVRPT